MNLQEMTREELLALREAIEKELAAKQAADADATRTLNERLRKAREIMRQADCVSIKPYNRTGDRRIYLNWSNGNRWAFGQKYGSAQYPIETVYYLDGSERHAPGWSIYPERISEKVQAMFAEVLRALETNAERFVAEGKTLYL